MEKGLRGLALRVVGACSYPEPLRLRLLACILADRVL